MDTNRILLWMVSLSCVVMLARYGRARIPGVRGWLAVCLLVLALTWTAYLFRPEQAGYLGGVGWALVILLPAWGNQWLHRLVNRQQYGRARRLALWLRVLHPMDGWTWQPLIMQAHQAAQRGDVARATQLFQRVADGGPPTVRRQATGHLFRLQRDWAGLLAWSDAQLTEQDLVREPQLFVPILRALGETGQLGRLLSLLDRLFSALAQPALAPVQAAAYLVCFAFCGRAAAVSQVLQSLLRSYGEEIKQFWLATAALTAGDETAARAVFQQLTGDRDVALRDAATDRLARPLRRAGDVLTAEDTHILAKLEAALALEARDSGGLGAQGARPVATFVLVAVNVAYFLAEVIGGGSENPETLYWMGAAFSEGFGPGQAWRLVASTFLHWGPLHLVMNMLGLLVIGPYVERALGRARYVAVYLASGILGALVVMLSSSEPAFLVGASACIMGLVGATAAVLLRAWRKERSRPAARRLAGVAFIVVLQVAFDLSTPEVSFRAHFGGLLAGLVITAFLRHWQLPAARSGTAPAPR